MTISRSPTVRVAALITTVVVVALIALRIGGSVSGQGGSSYVYSTEDRGDSVFVVDVDLVNQDADFTAYKAENDSRIDGWAANPSTAPVLDGRPVMVTFLEPKSITETMQIIGATSTVFDTDAYRLVGYSSQSPERYYDGWGPIDPTLLGPPVLGPECDVDPSLCDPITFTGVMDVQFFLQGGIAALQALKDNPNVFLADSTGIEITDEILSTIPQAQIESIMLPSAMYDSTVTYP